MANMHPKQETPPTGFTTFNQLQVDEWFVPLGGPGSSILCRKCEFGEYEAVGIDSQGCLTEDNRRRPDDDFPVVRANPMYKSWV